MTKTGRFALGCFLIVALPSSAPGAPALPENVPGAPALPASAPGTSEVRQEPLADEWLARPVDDAKFRTFLDFFAYDREVPFDARIIDEKETDGIHRQHLSFQSTQDERIYAHLYRPATSATKDMPAVILLHGGVPTGKEWGATKLFSELIARAGWTVLAIDMMYFGERNTGLLKTFTNPEKAERLYNQPSLYLAWVTQTVKDVGRSLDFLVEERGADPERITLVGISRGAQISAIVGGAERRLAAVALLIGGHFDALETGHRPAACPANYIGRISPRPLLMINGKRDPDYNPEASVLPLQRLAKDPKEFVWIDSGHTVATEAAQSAALEWLRKHAR